MKKACTDFILMFFLKYEPNLFTHNLLLRYPVKPFTPSQNVLLTTALSDAVVVDARGSGGGRRQRAVTGWDQQQDH